MIQQYTPYWLWECYKNGMWDKSIELNPDTLSMAIDFTSDHKLYGSAMREVVFLWENSMLNFLTNKSINRKAYLGHCAVCYKIGLPEFIVRAAWKHLSEKQRSLANLEAEKTIKIWEQKQKLKNMLKHGRIDAIQTAYQMNLQLK